MPPFLANLSAKVIAIIIGAALVIALAMIAWGAWQHSRTEAGRARLSASQTQAVQASATDAVNATGAVSARQQATDDLTRTNADAIHAAKGADAPVDPAARDAGLIGLCRRASYARDPKCVRLAPAK